MAELPEERLLEIAAMGSEGGGLVPYSVPAAQGSLEEYARRKASAFAAVLSCPIDSRIGLVPDLGTGVRMTALLPAQILRFLLAIFHPLVAERAGALLDVGFLVGFVTALLLE